MTIIEKKRVAMSVHFVLHNLVAHPLLVLCPPLGRWLHQHWNLDDEWSVEAET